MAYVGRDVDTIEPTLRQLCLYIECANRINLVAEEVETVGQLVAVAVNVEYRAANGILAGLVYVVSLFEAVFFEPLLGLMHARTGVFAESDGVLLYVFARGNALCNRVGICDNEAHISGRDTCEGLGAQYLVGRVDLSVFYVAFESRGQNSHVFLAENTAEVEVKISGVVEAVAYYNHRHFRFYGRKRYRGR